MSEAIGYKPGRIIRAGVKELFHTTGLRAIFAVGLALAIIGSAGTADAALPKRAKKDKETKKASAPIPKGPLHIIVSIGRQRVALYANGAHVASSAISSGTRTHPTPTGVFSIIQKNRHHRSNIYSGAPMPYMQRITWSGVALHQGVLPGYPASHGCIRLPTDFASYLWTTTKMNARVIVTQGEVAPVEIAHPRLFVHKKPDVPAAEQSSEAPKPEVRTAQTADPRKASDAPKAAEAPVPAGTASKPTAAKVAAPRRAPVVRAEAPERNNTVESSKLADNGAVLNTIANAAKEGSKDAPVATGTIAAPASILAMELKPTVPATAPAAKPAEATPELKAEEKAGETAKPEEIAKPKPPKPDPISVFISRKTGKLYVRHGWEPLFETPVTIRDPDLVWGTHVLTALEFKEDKSTLRWVAVTLPPDTPRRAESKRTPGKSAARREISPPPAAEPRSQLSASQVLDLLDIPQDAIDRISELMKPGSSLIVSDNPMSHETGKGTDFVILTRS